MADLDQEQRTLVAYFENLGRCIIAFSGGVDSAVVAKAAFLALGENALAVTADSPSLARAELEEASQVASLIGITHRIVATNELAREEYVRNAADRCYHCKTELYDHLEQIARDEGVATIVNGANTDDLGDYRPGMQAAAEFRVVSPLIECGYNKQSVRQLAAHWQLPIWDKPASPCLASRIAYGEEVSPDRLAMIEDAERFLKERGFRNVRVRYHRGDLARVELPADELERLCEPSLREALNKHFTDLGFKFITLDLQGFRSGSLNALVPLQLPGQ